MALLAKSAPTRGSSSGSAPSGSVRKRHRSTSLSDEDLDDSYDSDSPPPSKRRGLPGDGEPSAADLSAEIWKLFGKDKRHYVERDVLSDDEDMEVDAAALEREEKRSHRLARKEDAEAEEEERRREEEKRRKRREKDARERKGGY